ncbi:MAG: tRNA preQ1(34) S-adenosylmethionine ribosyltransferase-isomerase QueA [Bacillota bacterium]
MKVSQFDYHLPPELIAQKFLTNRDQSRLLVVDRRDGSISHRMFRDLWEYIPRDDLLVVNDTKVIRARLLGRRATGGKVEVLLLKPLGDDRWECLVRPGHKVRTGDMLYIGTREEAELQGQVMSSTDFGGRVIRWQYQGSWDELLERVGEVPLPPYIKAPLDEVSRYQTVYARVPGSAAAPTAGLHFTTELMSALKDKGVRIESLTLNVGLGTFRPVKEEVIEDHKMHQERFVVPPRLVDAISSLRERQGHLWAVGTTVVRALESASAGSGLVRPMDGETDLFIYPGYRFEVVDHLVTNFHLPKSTLLMMVSAFAGTELIMEAYREAVRLRYRFFSLGDAMLIL